MTTPQDDRDGETKLIAVEVNYTFNPTNRPGGERHSCIVTPAGEGGEDAKFNVTLTPKQLVAMRAEIGTGGFAYLPWKP